MFSGSFAPEARQRFAVRDLKLRAVMMASLVPRTIKEAMRISPQAARYSYWIDTFGLDSQYDLRSCVGEMRGAAPFQRNSLVARGLGVLQ